MAVYRCARSCTRVHGLYTAAIHGPVRAVNTAEYTAVYRPCTRFINGRVQGLYTAVTRPCTCREDGRVRAMNTAVYRLCTQPFTGRIQCRVHTRRVYTAVYVYGPRTRLVHGRVRGRVHMCTARRRPLHGRVRAVNTA